MGKPHSRSRPPQRVSEALHMSPPHHLRRRKNEDPDVRIGEEVTSRIAEAGPSFIYVLLYT